MRSLVVAQDFPWPTGLGSHLRLEQVVASLAEVGDVDLFCLVPARRDEACVVPDAVTLRRLLVARTGPPPGAVRRRLAWMTSRLPFEVAEVQPGLACERFAPWAEPPYDVVWFSKALTYQVLGRPRLGPTVVDLDDLEDDKILARAALLRAGGTPAPRHAAGAGHVPQARLDLAAAARGALAHAQARHNAARWGRFQRSVAAEVDAVVLCSDEDAARSGLANATVVPNVYPPPDGVPDHGTVGHPATVLFAGNFCYGPNADGARWFTSQILPVLRRHRPDVVLRLVGEPDTSVRRLHRPPDVVVAGRVPSMEPELAGADLAVVPLRYGSGTRVKILEAFAHRLPVVSTALGAAGLDITPGQHLLTADDPAAFAAACADALGQPELRRRLADAAWRHYEARFQPAAARRRIQELAAAVTAKH